MPLSELSHFPVHYLHNLEDICHCFRLLFRYISGLWTHLFISILDFPDSSAGEESACNAGDPSSIPGLGRSTGEGIGYTPVFFIFPCGSDGEESAYNAGDLGSIPGLGTSPGEGNSYQLQDSGLENSMDYIVHGGRKESDTTEQLSLHFIHFNVRGIPFLMKLAVATTHIEHKMLEIHLLNLLCSSARATGSRHERHTLRPGSEGNFPQIMEPAAVSPWRVPEPYDEVVSGASSPVSNKWFIQQGFLWCPGHYFQLFNIHSSSSVPSRFLWIPQHPFRGLLFYLKVGFYCLLLKALLILMSHSLGYSYQFHKSTTWIGFFYQVIILSNIL